jgi:hypothetical protein
LTAVVVREVRQQNLVDTIDDSPFLNTGHDDRKEPMR